MKDAKTRPVEGGSREAVGAELRSGDAVGRYVVRERVGGGGMGSVYAALDPELDRTVVVKLVKPDVASDALSARLIREAQAQARLSHANVVTVLDVGTVGEQVFVAMEYVKGTTLASWQRAEKRSWRDIVTAYAQAGRGLAAAHGANIVHRDFKPDNALIDDEGRVLVTDFGIAHAIGSRDLREDDDAAAPRRDDPLATPLTQTGSLMGTPWYMAPEQHMRRGTTPATDQFSFCVALYEALYGEHAFAPEDATVGQLAGAVVAGKVRDAPAGSEVPSWVRRALVRGLEKEPADRYPDMTHLIDALRHDPGVARRRWLVIGAIVAVFVAAGVVAFGKFTMSSRSKICDGMEARLDGVWDAERKRAVRAAFDATELAYAEETFGIVDTALGRYSRAWIKARTAACEDTHVRREQTPMQMDLRMHCLDARLVELGALVGVLAGTDAESLPQAAPAVHALRSPDECSDAQALSAGVAPPPAADAERVDALRAELARVTSLELAGRYNDALPPAVAAADAARALGYRPLEAEALYILGRAQERADDHTGASTSLNDAVLAASASGSLRLELEATTSLMFLHGFAKQSYDEAKRYQRQAAALLEHAGGHAGVTAEVRFHMSTGVVLHEIGNYAEAEEEFRIAIELAERGLDEVHPLFAQALNFSATAERHAGRTDRAMELSQRAAAITEASLGPNHPELARALDGIGSAYMSAGTFAEAEAPLLRALAIRRAVHGDQHEEVADSLSSLARALAMRGDYDGAIANLTEAADIRRAVLGPGHPNVGSVVNNLGEVQRMKGDYAGALETYRTAHAIWLEALGEKHPRVAVALNNIATAQLELGERADALATARKAASVFEAALGPKHPIIAAPLTVAGRALVATGKSRRAIPMLERALELRSAESTDPAERSETRFALAEALWEANANRERAVELATEALADAQSAGPHAADAAARIEAWLTAHR